jgi:hypothetical protein
MTQETTPVSEHVQELIETDGITDVTDEYPELVDMVAELSETRAVPVPLQRIVVYTVDDHDTLTVLSIVDTNDDVLSSMFAFESNIESDVADSIAGEGDDYAEQIDLFVQDVIRNIRIAQEAIWDEVVNIPTMGDDSDGE